jgi:hypothetical protein
MTNTTILYKEINWLTQELARIDYSDNTALAQAYELGLLRSILAQLLYNDSHNIQVVKHTIQRNPHYVKR